MAVTFRASLMPTVQVAELPLHAPDHPVRTEPVPGTAVSATVVFSGTDAEHAVAPWPQLIPAACELTRPVPPPATTTWRR